MRLAGPQSNKCFIEDSSFGKVGAVEEPWFVPRTKLSSPLFFRTQSLATPSQWSAYCPSPTTYRRCDLGSCNPNEAIKRLCFFGFRHFDEHLLSISALAFCWRLSSNVRCCRSWIFESHSERCESFGANALSGFQNHRMVVALVRKRLRFRGLRPKIMEAVAVSLVVVLGQCQPSGLFDQPV